MAKPIRATPTLTGQDAINFVLQMRRKEKDNQLTNNEKELIQIMKENKKILSN